MEVKLVGFTLCLLVCIQLAGTLQMDGALSAVKANNEFGLQLYKESCRTPGNIFFSPISAHAVLTMAYTGARGTTADEMATALHLQGMDQLRVKEDYKEILSGLKKINSNLTLDMANKIFLDKQTNITEAYRNSTKYYFMSEPELVNFRQEHENARAVINDWIEKTTRGKIKQVLPQQSVKRSTRFILVNALYFKGNWKIRFDEALSTVWKFQKNKATSVNVKMMHSENIFGYMEFDDMKVLVMNYEGNEVDMVVLLPNDVDGISKLEENLLHLDWNLIDSNAYPQQVSVYFPKFKLETMMELNENLIKLGMKQAFIRKEADFKNITDDENIYVSNVIQKAFVEVDEKGSEAAAATAVIMTLGYSDIPQLPPPVPIFKADHPFIFLIRHKPSRTILFIGRLTEPTLAQD